LVAGLLTAGQWPDGAGPVTLTPTRGSFATYFNRGILSTQFLAHAIPPGPSGAPDYKVLTNRIDQPGDPLRSAFAGQILDGLELLFGAPRPKVDRATPPSMS
jgi:hypothetical protein